MLKRNFIITCTTVLLGFCVASSYADTIATPTSTTETTTVATAPVSDATITSNISSQYAQDKFLSPFNIGVTSTNGQVALSGLVTTDLQFEKAVTLAEATDGVNKVDTSNLKIKDSKAPMADTLITAQVKGLLLKNKFTKGDDASFWPIHVETKDSVVHLAGQADSQAQINDIVKLAKSVSGVKSVKSDLKVVKN